MRKRERKERERKAKYPQAGRRLKELISEKGMSQADFVRLLDQSDCIRVGAGQLSSIINGVYDLQRDQAEAWISFFPEYRVEYLMGLDDFPTDADKRRADRIDEIKNMLDMKYTGFHSIVKSIGYTIERAIPEYETMKGYFEHRKAGYNILEKGKVKANIKETVYEELIAEVADYVEMKLKRIIEKGEKEDGKHPKEK